MIFSRNAVLNRCRTSSFLTVSRRHITTLKLHTLSSEPCELTIRHGLRRKNVTPSRSGQRIIVNIHNLDMNRAGQKLLNHGAPMFTHSVPSFSVRRNRVLNLVKSGKINGDALTHALYNLTTPLGNVILLGKAGTDHNTLAHTKFLIVRSIGCRLFSSDIQRRTLLKLSKVSSTIHSQYSTILQSLSLLSSIRHRPVDLSNNRGRELTVTYTLVDSGQFVILSRPADKLSQLRVARINKLLQGLTSHNGTILIMARSCRLTTL